MKQGEKTAMIQKTEYSIEIVKDAEMIAGSGIFQWKDQLYYI